MRKQIAAANWKMNLTVDKAGALLNDILAADIALNEDQLAVFAVPFPYLQQAQQQLNDRGKFFYCRTKLLQQKVGAYYRGSFR
jgi:triosephosphate isomerase